MKSPFDEIDMTEYYKEEERCKKEFLALGLDCYGSEYNYDHFTEFISMLLHKNKSMGSDWVVNTFIKRNIGLWGNLHENLFAVGYAEWLCNKYGVSRPDYLNMYEGIKLDKWLFHQGAVILNRYQKYLKEYTDCLVEFKKYRLVVSESILREVV